MDQNLETVARRQIEDILNESKIRISSDHHFVVLPNKSLLTGEMFNLIQLTYKNVWIENLGNDTQALCICMNDANKTCMECTRSRNIYRLYKNGVFKDI